MPAGAFAAGAVTAHAATIPHLHRTVRGTLTNIRSHAAEGTATVRIGRDTEPHAAVAARPPGGYHRPAAGRGGRA